MKAGDKVVVVAAYDDTLPEEFIGRLGVIIRRLDYQGIGDSPSEGDPLILVAHAPSMGRPFEKQSYWREEIALL